MSYKDPTKQREYQRLWMAKRRSEFFSGKFCVKCGSKENLELDHIDPSKKTTHRIWSWSKQRRETEIAKCQVLCWKHHKEKSLQEQFQVELYGHGSAAGYKLRKCRCNKCVQWKRVENAKYQDRRNKKTP